MRCCDGKWLGCPDTLRVWRMGPVGRFDAASRAE